MPSETPVARFMRTINIPLWVWLLTGTFLMLWLVVASKKLAAFLLFKKFSVERTKTITGGITFVLLAACLATSHMFYLYLAARSSDCYLPIQYTHANGNLSHQVFKFLELHASQVKWWIDFGSALSYARNLEVIPWDPDSDVSVILPDSMTVEDLTKLVQQHFQYIPMVGVRTAVHPSVDGTRHVKYVEVFLGDHVHTDIFVWSYVGESQEAIEFHSYTNVQPIRPTRLVLPTHNARYRGTNINLPHDLHQLLTFAYGDNYITPAVSKLECFENIWNGLTYGPHVLLKSYAFGMTLASLIVWVWRLFGRQGSRKRSARSLA